MHVLVDLWGDTRDATAHEQPHLIESREHGCRHTQLYPIRIYQSVTPVQILHLEKLLRFDLVRI